MPIESPFTHITDLNASNPLVGDDVGEGDDHIRGLKTVLLTDFPNINAAVNCSPAELNVNYQVTGGTVTASKTVVADASKDIGVFGEVTAATFTGTNVDGILGANTPATITGTNITLASGATVTGINDTDSMSDASATTLATSESIKAYADSLAVPFAVGYIANNGTASGTINGSLGGTVYTVTFDTNPGTANYVAQLTVDNFGQSFGSYIVNIHSLGATSFTFGVADGFTSSDYVNSGFNGVYVTCIKW